MFFEVQAKCGHVGRNKYVIKNFYVKTESGKEAARKIRMTSRVKHDHKDAILNVREITYEEYVAGVIRCQEDDYFKIHNSSDQKRIQTEGIMYEEKIEKERTREVCFKLKKWKIIELEAKKMVLGACYG